MNDSETNQLISRALAGDQPAREKLLLRNQDRLRGMIKIFLDPRLSARVDPSDVLQEVFVTADAKLSDYLRDPKRAFYPWIRRIVRDQLIDIYRRHVQAERRSVKREKRDQPRFSDASASQLVDRLVGNETSPSGVLIREERREHVWRALRQISSDNQEILLMRFVEQLSVGEISEVLSISEAAAKSRIRRSLEKMHGIIGETEDSHE